MLTNYSSALTPGFPGMIHDSGDRHIVSRVNPDVVIPMGCAVAPGSADDHVILPTTADQVTNAEGIAVHDWLSESGGVYPLKSAVSVMRQGRCWVQVEEAVVKGDPVYVRFATQGARTQKGAIRKSADTATAAQLPTAKFGCSASAGGMAYIEINLP